jgi:hypothetical protein
LFYDKPEPSFWKLLKGRLGLNRESAADPVTSLIIRHGRETNAKLDEFLLNCDEIRFFEICVRPLARKGAKEQTASNGD